MAYRIDMSSTTDKFPISKKFLKEHGVKYARVFNGVRMFNRARMYGEVLYENGEAFTIGFKGQGRLDECVKQLEEAIERKAVESVACEGKAKHKSRNAAEQSLKAMSRAGRLESQPGRVISTYFCPTCRHWHIGSRPLTKKERI